MGFELPPDKVHIGPSDYVPFLGDTKICYIKALGEGFGGANILIDLKLEVIDSPNSAAVVMDAVRCAKVALDDGIAGPIYSVSAFTMKHPPKFMTDEEAFELVEKFIKGEIKY